MAAQGIGARAGPSAEGGKEVGDHVVGPLVDLALPIAARDVAVAA